MSFHTTSSVFSLPKNARCNSQNLNLYHYAGNNPVKYVDPDGRKDCGISDENNQYTPKCIKENTNILVERNSEKIDKNYK